MLEIAFSSARKIVFSLQNRKGRGGESRERFCILIPFSVPPSHYATFSLRATAVVRSGQENEKCGICYACELNDVNIWLAKAEET